MASIHLTTFIAAPVDRVFDLSRHIALYKQLFHNRKERLSSGAGSNMLAKGETLSVLVKKGGKSRMSMIKITALQRPVSFVEEQVKGDLEKFRHEHHFKPVQNGTIIIDMVEYGMPKDFFGRILGKIYFKKYMEELLNKRNELIRTYAETEKWRAVL
jgi:ligand-binding SRPBCC domain-containing protein